MRFGGCEESFARGVASRSFTASGTRSGPTSIRSRASTVAAAAGSRPFGGGSVGFTAPIRRTTGPTTSN